MGSSDTFFRGNEALHYQGTPDDITCSDCRCAYNRGGPRCQGAVDQMMRMQQRRFLKEPGIPQQPQPGSRYILAGPQGGIPGRLGENLEFVPDAAQPLPKLPTRRRRAIRSCI